MSKPKSNNLSCSSSHNLLDGIILNVLKRSIGRSFCIFLFLVLLGKMVLFEKLTKQHCSRCENWWNYRSRSQFYYISSLLEYHEQIPLINKRFQDTTLIILFLLGNIHLVCTKKFPKKIFLSYPLIRTRTRAYAYRQVRNVSF